jgi:long-chain acyl-CoA synthetase
MAMTRRLDTLVARALDGPGDEPALLFKGEEIRWSYLRRVAEQVDQALTRAGLGAAVRIGFVPRNRPAFAAALLALLGGRRSIIMVYAFQSPEAIAADLKRLDLPAVIADAQDWNDVTLGALGPSTLAISLASSVDAAEQVRILTQGASAPTADARTAEPVVELLTSGTTGAPKRNATLYTTIETAVLAQGVIGQSASEGSSPAGDPGTVNFPISNISGIYSYLPYAVSRQLVLFQEKFDLDDWLAFVARYRPATVILPPAGVRMLLDRKDLADDALAGVRFVQIGTAAVDAESHRAFEARFGVVILLSYGATEFCGAATAMTAALHQEYGVAKFGSVGRPTGRNEVRIVDPVNFEPMPSGDTGLIEVKVPFLGDAYIRTTDLGMIDFDGFLFHRGRVDGVIVRGGFKIMPGTIEAVINRIDGVAQSCVVGVPDRRLGEVPVAVIEMQQGRNPHTHEVVEQAIRAALPATNVPVTYLFVAALPRTPSLKIDLKHVKALAAEHATSGAAM